MKIITVVGARPQFVKAAVLSRLIKEKDGIQEIIVHTGQHFDSNMSDIFFEQMSIPKPDYRLEVGGKGHGAMTGQMLTELEPIMQKEDPDLVLVYGDTNSTLAGALDAAKLHLPVAHVEAGLRSFNMKMPEEINRILTDRLSNWLFCSTDSSRKQLILEGISEEKISVVGDIMYDAALFYRESLQPTSEVVKYKEAHEKFSLCTIHRAENTDDPEKLKEILGALSEISETTPIYLPLHPRTKKKLESLDLTWGNIHVVEPIGYGDILYLLSHCEMVLTDSGGMQKEAYFFSKPCITMRSETEWTETVDAGVNRITGHNKNKILSNFEYFSQNAPTFPKGIYGEGNTGEKILEHLLSSYTSTH